MLTYLVAHSGSVAHEGGKVFAVECEEVVGEGLIQQGVAPPPHLLRRGGGEGVAAVADHDVGTFRDVDLGQKNPADLSGPEEKVPTHRQEQLQVLAEVVHELALI